MKYHRSTSFPGSAASVYSRLRRNTNLGEILTVVAGGERYIWKRWSISYASKCKHFHFVISGFIQRPEKYFVDSINCRYFLKVICASSFSPILRSFVADTKALYNTITILLRNLAPIDPRGSGIQDLYIHTRRCSTGN